MKKKDQKKTTFERKKDQTAECIPVKINLVCMKHAYGNLLGIYCLNIDHHLPTLEIQLLSHWYTKSKSTEMDKYIKDPALLQCKKRLDRWILQKHFSSQKNIFYNWKFSEKRPFRQKKRLFWWKKDLFLAVFWKKSVNRPSHGKKDLLVNTAIEMKWQCWTTLLGISAKMQNILLTRGYS